MKTYELKAIYDARKSFYGKANVRYAENEEELISYDTHVASVVTVNGIPEARVFGLYSNTTTRHIKEFLRQQGFKAESSKQILKDYKYDRNAPVNTEAEDTSGLKTVAAVMALGDIFSDNQKDSNDWKARMLKAGLDGRGLLMPEDWDALPEAEKTDRLNKVIKELSA